MRDAAFATMGSTQSFERYPQMADWTRRADVQGGNFETSTKEDCFSFKQTLAKIEAMTGSRTKRSFALGGDLRIAEIYEGHSRLLDYTCYRDVAAGPGACPDLGNV